MHTTRGAEPVSTAGHDGHIKQYDPTAQSAETVPSGMLIIIRRRLDETEAEYLHRRANQLGYPAGIIEHGGIRCVLAPWEVDYWLHPFRRHKYLLTVDASTTVEDIQEAL